MKINLVGRKEAAQLLGVSPQRLAKLMEKYADFPEPVAEISAGTIWLAGDLEVWATEHGRSVVPSLTDS